MHANGWRKQSSHSHDHLEEIAAEHMWRAPTAGHGSALNACNFIFSGPLQCLGTVFATVGGRKNRIAKQKRVHFSKEMNQAMRP